MNIFNEFDYLLCNNLKFTPLYHYTKLVSAMNIIETNTLHAPFGIRFTRNSNLHYKSIQGFGGTQVQIEVNKDLLSHNYKISPIKDTNYYMLYDKITDESEEMVHTDKINKISRYITKIKIFKNIIDLRDSKLQILLHRFFLKDLEKDIDFDDILDYFSDFKVEVE